MKQIQFVTKPQFQETVQNNKYVVANFTASWCGPCQMMKPILDEIYQEPKYKDIEIIRIDLDTNQELASMYQITGIPAYLFFKDGQVVDRVRGANPQIRANFDKLLGTESGADSETAKAATVPSEIADLIPKGYQILNDSILGGDFEALNTIALHGTEIKEVFNINNSSSTILSDGDSQALLYVPLTQISKIYSILIKTKTIDSVSDSDNLDADDLEETQPPNLLKVWGNKMNLLSFDDAINSEAQHSEKFELVSDQWYECKLKFVRFQTVQSLNLFFDGEDEDFHTIIDKIVLIGLGGEKNDHKNIGELLNPPPEQ